MISSDQKPLISIKLFFAIQIRNSSINSFVNFFKMTISPLPDITLSAKDYHLITIDIFQRYVDECFEGKFLWKSIKIDFKYWTKENWDAFNGKTLNKILRYCIPRSIWIEESDNQSKILMKFVLAPTYDIDLEDLDMHRIKKVENTNSKVSRGI